MKDPATWIWFGYPQHLCVRQKCRFHLSTDVGEYIVSTIGSYFPDPDGEMEEVGLDRFFETFVFPNEGPNPCGCCVSIGDEVDATGYNSEAEAQAGHMEMCRKWAES
jgi:hypothetical protein